MRFNRIACILLLAAVPCAGASAQESAVRLQDIDTNRDGIASPEETRAYLDGIARQRASQPARRIAPAPAAKAQARIAYHPLDKNRDGVVSDSEKAAYANARKAAAPAAAPTRKKIAFDIPDNARADQRRDYELRLKEMEQLDANGDGIVDARELRGGAGRKFDAADTNRDGVLSDSEVKASLGRIEQQAGGKDDALARQRAGRVKNRYKNADRDGDGEVSRQEYETYFGGRQQNFDRDGDGRVTADEYRTDGERLPSSYIGKQRGNLQ